MTLIFDRGEFLIIQYNLPEIGRGKRGDEDVELAFVSATRCVLDQR